LSSVLGLRTLDHESPLSVNRIDDPVKYGKELYRPTEAIPIGFAYALAVDNDRPVRALAALVISWPDWRVPPENTIVLNFLTISSDG
jgi:hypothetical protein